MEWEEEMGSSYDSTGGMLKVTYHFFREIGSSPVCTVMLGDRKMEFILCSIAREEFRRLSSVRPFVTPMKSSMYILCRLIGVLRTDFLAVILVPSSVPGVRSQRLFCVEQLGDGDPCSFRSFTK